MNQSTDIVSNYLRFYRTLENPGFAVLVKGDWGAGKTYTIKDVLKDDMYYVSLFGLTSQKEIFASVFLSMFPLRAKTKSISERVKGASQGTEAFTFGIGNVLGGLTDAFIKEEVKNDKVLVFDDLERASLDVKQILGAINKYVEHHNCSVIVIAHDAKLSKDFSEAKEKVFGQVLHVKPNIPQTLNIFIERSYSPLTARKLEKYLLDVFTASKCQSLRILKHVIDDCLRLYACLEERHLCKSESISHLFMMFSAFSISFRSGDIDSKDMNNRMLLSIKSITGKEKGETEISNYQKMKSRFASDALTIRFESNILSDQLLKETICNGFYDKDSIVHHLDTSLYFSTIDKVPSWKSIMSFDELDNAELQGAITKLREEERSFQIIDDGDILHTFTMKCLMSDIGETQETIQHVLDSTKNYIDSLLEKGLLPHRIMNARLDSYSLESAHGYGFWIKDSYRQEFKDIAAYLASSRDKALELEYPKILKEVIDLMKSDINAFKEIISRDPNQLGMYSQVPFLQTIQPKLFLKEWLSLPRHNWQKVKQALEYRYDTGLIRSVLAEEKEWIEQLNIEIDSKAGTETGLSKLRIERLHPRIALT